MARRPKFQLKSPSLAVLAAVILAVAFLPRHKGEVRARGVVVPTLAKAPAIAAPPDELPEAKPRSVRVRVVDPGGRPIVGSRVRARVSDPSGASLVDAHGATGADGVVEFTGLAGLAQKFERGSQLAVSFEEARPGRLVFGARSIPMRELTLVQTAAAAPEPVPQPLANERAQREAQPVPSAAAEQDESVSQSAPVSVEPALEVEPAPELASAPEVESRPEVVEHPGDPKSVLPKPVPREWPRELEPLPPGSLSGQVALDEGVPAYELRAELSEVLPGQPGLRGRVLGPVTLGEDGSFHFDGIAPGLCSVRLSLWGSARTLAWIDDLEVSPGEELLDPRLEPFALHGRLMPVEVELFDPEGRRLELAVVAPLDEKTGGVGSLRVQRPGSTPRLWCDRRALDGEGGLNVVLEAPGFRTRREFLRAEELGAKSPVQLVLERERTRSLELRLVTAPPKDTLLEVRLERPSGGERPWDFSRHRASMDARGRARLQPAETGDFVVRVFDVTGGRERDLGLAVPVTVEAEASVAARSGAGQVVDVLYLPLPPGALR